MKYKCIFFDLDHTLWDYESNSRETLEGLFETYGLLERGVHNPAAFASTFTLVNDKLWDLYDRGIIGSEIIRAERFQRILTEFGIDDHSLSTELSEAYLADCPKRSNLMPHAEETLRYLAGHYALTVVTNGFEDIQHIKLASGNLRHFFDHIITSQKTGHKKPAREIFEYALRSNAIEAHQAVMVGDNLVTDIGGAMNASIDAAYYNPARLTHNSPVHYEIKSLIELCDLL